jgi:hypothetical protein
MLRMYAIHIRLDSPGRHGFALDIGAVAQELQRIPGCTVEHFYAHRATAVAEAGPSGAGGVLYVLGRSLEVAGNGALAAVRAVLAGAPASAALETPAHRWATGLCDATVRVGFDRHRGAAPAGSGERQESLPS